MLAAALVVAAPALPHAEGQPPRSQDEGHVDIDKLRAAAEAGDAVAKYKLGAVYSSGDQIAKDPAKAFYWIKQSAEEGYILAWLSLGMMYRMGEGVERDDIESYKWFELVAWLTPKDWPAEIRQSATEDRALVAEHLTPAQVSEAKTRARQWWAHIEATHPRRQ
jgi:TPR repeat protein